jgi:hypothetical protein
MTYTDIELCSAALTKLGARPITSFADGSVESEISARLYPIVRDALLSAHPWAFTLAQATLDADPVPPPGDFAFAFVLPSDLLRTLSAGHSGSGRGLVYRVFGTRLHADAEAILLTYQRRVPEAEFPVHFASALVARLSAELCLPVTENSSRSEVLFKLAAAELQLAKLLDSQQSTPGRVEDYSLITARLS